MISRIVNKRIGRGSLRRWWSKWVLLVYLIGLGFLISKWVMVLTTYGRRTRRLRKTGLWYVEEGRSIYCLSRRGASSQWLKNMEACPDVYIRIGHTTRLAEGLLVEGEFERERILSKFHDKYRGLAGLLLQRDRAKLVVFSFS